MYIYIPGNERGSNEKYKESRKLRNAFDMVKESFHDSFPAAEILGQSVCEYPSTLSFLVRNHFSMIWNNFESIFIDLVSLYLGKKCIIHDW
jgi:RAB protein geranylgeranyltransferase component A